MKKMGKPEDVANVGRCPWPLPGVRLYHGRDRVDGGLAI